MSVRTRFASSAVGRMARRALARIWRLGRGALRRAVKSWRRSIQVRVVATTLLLSLLVVALLGAFLVSQIRKGLLEGKVRSSTLSAQAGFAEAQSEMNAAKAQLTPGHGPAAGAGAAEPSAPNDIGQLYTQVTEDLARGAGGTGGYQVILLSSGGDTVGGATAGGRDPRGTGGILPSSVPAGLRAAVDSEPGQPHAWYARLAYAPAPGETQVRTTAGLLVGRLGADPEGHSYQLFFAFPFDHEQATLALVKQTLAVVAVVLLALLSAIAALVTRQVVTPVRMAARIAERLAAGGLEERMQVRGEDDLARLAFSFNKMATSLQQQIRQLEELSRVQRRFVSDVSHELRTPLTTVRMAADLLHESRDEFDPAVARSAELLQAQLDRFEALLGDLLEISRFDAGAAVLEAEPVDIRMLVERVVEAAEPLAARNGGALVIRAPDRPCMAEVDPRRIERVLRNLVVNAVEHGEGRDVLVRVAASEDAIAVAVRDYGVGLKPGESSLVFNRFWRADPARARTTGGTGLGLSIAQEDAHLHNGWLQAWGEPGGGSQFRLTLPRSAGHELVRSPIPLEPDDSRNNRRVGYDLVLYRRRVGIGGGGAS